MRLIRILLIINHKPIKMKNLFILLFIASSFYSLAQEITGTVRTSDKYSNAIKKMNSEYFKNDFTTFKKIFSDDATFSVNGEEFTKSQIIEGFSMHHKFYSNIKMQYSFVETTFYDENNNNQVWSHNWGLWDGVSKRTKKNVPNPVNVSFKWVDGKIVNASWIYDPTQLNEEIMASQK